MLFRSTRTDEHAPVVIWYKKTRGSARACQPDSGTFRRIGKGFVLGGERNALAQCEVEIRRIMGSELYSENLQDGRKMETVTIRNPFVQ